MTQYSEDGRILISAQEWARLMADLGHCRACRERLYATYQVDRSVA